MKKSKILVIDDNYEFLESINDILMYERYEVLSAQDGEKGLSLARQNKPDLILCDISMKQKDGFTVLKELQQHETTSSIPSVFITAHAEESKITKSTRMGAKGYLVKPFTRKELIEIITRSL